MNLVNIIYESFTKEPKEREPQKVMTFSPNNLMECRRALYWKRKGEQPTNPPDNASLFKMRMGDIIHDNILTLLKELGFIESSEELKKIDYEGLEFNYKYDGILKQEEHRAVLEIKTIYANGFRSIENEPKPEHVMQVLSYMIFEGIKDGIILYIGRDNGYMIQYDLFIDSDGFLNVGVEVTDYVKKWRQRIEEMKKLKTMYAADSLPGRDFSIVMKRSGDEIAFDFQKDNVKYKSDRRCSYCSYFDKCWKAEKEEIRNHKFYIDNKFS